MASRNRNRQAPIKTDADEEKAMWNSLRADAKRIDVLVAEHNVIWERMQEIKESLEEQHANGEETTSSLETELAKLSRENIKLCEEITSSLTGQSDGQLAFLSTLDILKGLRQGSENDVPSQATPRPTAVNAKRSKSRKNDDEVESPIVSSPKVSVAATRIKAGTRAGSVPVVREISVKIEDGVDSGADVALKQAERLKIVLDSEVFYRTKKGMSRFLEKDDQGEGILCKVTNVIGEGKQRKYEILDVEPDEGASPYRASVSQMVAIPERNEGLQDPTPKRTVLAMYPGTTTFYRAEVVAVKGKEIQPGHVRLRFEDEDEKNKEMEVERRYVLLQWPGQ